MAEDMDKNVQQFQKSRYVSRAVKELVENSISTLKQIKRIDMSNWKTPKPNSTDLIF